MSREHPGLREVTALLVEHKPAMTYGAGELIGAARRSDQAQAVPMGWPVREEIPMGTHTHSSKLKKR